MIVGLQRLDTVKEMVTGPVTKVELVVMAPALQVGDVVTTGEKPQQIVDPLGSVRLPLLFEAVQ
jgi:hypothetical protein